MEGPRTAVLVGPVWSVPVYRSYAVLRTGPQSSSDITLGSRGNQESVALYIEKGVCASGHNRLGVLAGCNGVGVQGLAGITRKGVNIKPGLTT